MDGLRLQLSEGAARRWLNGSWLSARIWKVSLSPRGLWRTWSARRTRNTICLMRSVGRKVPIRSGFLCVPCLSLQTAAACGWVVTTLPSTAAISAALSCLVPLWSIFPPRKIPLAGQSNCRSFYQALAQSTLWKQGARALPFVLEELYVHVGRLVIEKLHEHGIPKQSTVSCCPTSVLCSHPLHAAEPSNQIVTLLRRACFFVPQHSQH
jgi:hypothetical protein